MNKILSASKAGFPCARNLWYTVNNHEAETKERAQRIFDVGTALEPVIVDWLRKDGWTVEYNPGSQNAEIKVTIPVNGGTIAGHPDCIISKGEIQNALVDIKTMNDRAFTQWKHEGTLKSKPQYVTQLHIYAMGLERQGRKIERLGIVGVNKNNSEMHIDFFDYDPFKANDIQKYAEMIFSLDSTPEIGCPAENWACNYCEFANSCEIYKKPAPVVVNNEPLTETQDENVISAMKDLKRARELTKEAKSLEKDARVILDKNVKDKGLPGIQGGGLVFTMNERKSTNFDSTAFKEAHPELVSEFTKTSVSYVYNIEEI